MSSSARDYSCQCIEFLAVNSLYNGEAHRVHNLCVELVSSDQAVTMKLLVFFISSRITLISRRPWPSLDLIIGCCEILLLNCKWHWSCFLENLKYQGWTWISSSTSFMHPSSFFQRLGTSCITCINVSPAPNYICQKWLSVVSMHPNESGMDIKV